MPRAHLLPLLALLRALFTSAARADDPSLLPKYGNAAKTEAQLAADARFPAAMDEHHGGDRKSASKGAAMQGWQAMRQGDRATAMRRFNQAWLLDRANAEAMWGMGAVQGREGKVTDAMRLFVEAAPSLQHNIDFAVDHAYTAGLAAASVNDQDALQPALERFKSIHQRAPDHTLNLQNWAITLFSFGRYAEAWEKITWAEATPRKAALNPRFIAALAQKMPRP